MLIIICGLPGSGKTTLAKSLSKRFAAVHVSSDITRKSMYQKPTYSEEEKAKVYANMVEEAKELLRQGRDVIADATFYRASERQRFLSLADEAGTEAFVIMTILSEEEIRKRLSRRKKGGPSDADFSVYFKVKGLFEELEGRHLVVDSSLRERDKVRMVQDFIGR
ncbi:MAG: AAA family ATPase [Candidatus Micrarchaeota archaeon]